MFQKTWRWNKNLCILVHILQIRLFSHNLNNIKRHSVSCRGVINKCRVRQWRPGMEAPISTVNLSFLKPTLKWLSAQMTGVLSPWWRTRTDGWDFPNRYSRFGFFFSLWTTGAGQVLLISLIYRSSEGLSQGEEMVFVYRIRRSCKFRM